MPVPVCLVHRVFVTWYDHLFLVDGMRWNDNLDSSPFHDIRVALWRNGRVSDLRSKVGVSIPGSGRKCVTTLGKLLTPACLNADSLRYYIESLTGYLYF